MTCSPALMETLRKNGQLHLLEGFDVLSEAEQAELLHDIESVNFDMMARADEETEKNYNIAPIDIFTADMADAEEAELKKLGLEAIAANKVAAVLLCGGQGTRLGFPHSKGMFDIGVTKPIYIFELHFAYLSKVAKEAGNYFPVFIMTSIYNDGEIREFLAEHDYFGYDKNAVFFYKQKMAYATDLEGKLLKGSPSTLVASPDGNGGWFASLAAAGYLDMLKEKGTEWLNIISIDNVLQRTVDPVFVGATVRANVSCGAKVICKNAPDERIGLLCLNDGKPTIIEYYELDQLVKETGLSIEGIDYGVILNYLFSVKEMERTLTESPLPVHKAKKKVPYWDGEKVVTPTTENGYKFEMLATDLVVQMGTCLPYEVRRELEFAPVKNKTGIDSVESARAMLEARGYTL